MFFMFSEFFGETEVYIGTVTSIMKDSHYDLQEIFRQIVSHGIHAHVYVSIWDVKDKAIRVRKFVEDRKPSAVFCGHIHEAHGIDMIGESILVNPGPARHGHCGLVSVNDKIEVELDLM